MQQNNETQQKVALGYIRISDKKQIEGESPITQRRKIQEYATANNIKMHDWFFDEAKSGKNTDREELQNMLKLARKLKGQINYIIVYKMSRASRNIETYVTDIVSVLAPLRINLVSATEQFDNTTPTGRFMQYLQVLVDQYDNENKRDVVIDNMSSLANQGYWLHHPPRGYDRHVIKNADGKPRTTIIANHEAAKVKEALLRWNRGDMTESQLVRHCTTIGFLGQNGKPITQDVLHKIIINPIYAGYVCCKLTNYQRIDGKHEGLISPEVFEQNQLVLRMKNKDYLLGLKHQKTNELFPLRRFVRCANCSGYLTAAKPNNSPRYWCHRKPSCSHTKSIMARTIHAQFTELLEAVTPTEGTLRLLREVLKRQVKQELGSVNTDINRIRELLSANDAFYQQILNKFIKESITEEQKDLAMKGMEEERASLQIQLAELQQRQTVSEGSIEFALNFMVGIGKRWENASLELRQAYQELVFPNGFVYDINTQNFLTPDISPLYRLELGETGAKDDKNFVMVTTRVSEWNSCRRDMTELYLRLINLGMEYRNGQACLADIRKVENATSSLRPRS